MSESASEAKQEPEKRPWKPAAQRVQRVVRHPLSMEPLKELPEKKRFLPEPRESRKEPEESDGSLEWILKEWLAFNEKLGEALGGKSGPTSKPPAKPAARLKKKEPAKPYKRIRLHTPLEPKEIQKKITRLEFRPEIRNGKLYFTCPCCQFPTTAFEHYAGEKTRCSRCLSAIKAPDPRTGRDARSLEKDLESILHPDRFVAVIPRRRTVWTVLPRAPLPVALGAAGALIFAFILGIEMFVGSKSGMAANPPAIESPFVKAMEAHRLPRGVVSRKVLLPPADHRERATQLVQEFADTTSTVKRRSLVKDAESVAIHIGNFYRKQEPNSHRNEHVITTSALAYYMESGLTIPVTEVVTRDDRQFEQVYLVEHRPGRDCIDWEASVGFNAEPLSRLLRETSPSDPGPEPRSLRLLANIDNYYNFDFDSEGQFLCVRLCDPNEPDEYAFGYIERDHPHAEVIEKYLSGADSWSQLPLTVDIRPAGSSEKTRQLEIVGFKGDHWRSDEENMGDGHALALN